MSDYNILIHVGYPKTATTWLQKNIFDEPKFGFISPWGKRAALAVDKFVTVNHFNFKPDSAWKNFENGIKKSNNKGLIPVLSQESLIGDVVKGCYWGKVVADNLNQTFPYAKVIITVREQCSFLLSAYGEYVLGGGICKIKRYIGAGSQKVGFSGICQLDELEYDLAVKYYQKKFGLENVKVLFFEDLLSDKKSFLTSLCKFAGSSISLPGVSEQKQHIGDRASTIYIRRFLNRYIPQPDRMHNVIPLSSRCLKKICAISNLISPIILNTWLKEKMKSDINKIVGDYFKESNRRLKEITGYLPLNYPV